ncbi:MinD-like ATPase involved in chromosome partitioning or flagellar assembly [Lentzea flaviverrucosa]|uniref:MinD-like ATPase involved in chromosome partitioning or flagellar assembly n=1 Tax=Lentzea flaviverrucosa TaxID=200379 RepID=A0A1H9SK54_9PSEU|nr:MinD-like ATPase involved in chromosome partitioning or flagellar assembly [Lentzea flaviverrucosa]SER85416.1 MinD-like ATPase involved in chromosome partitioning or flagellar assembly [Lentzea flaviverrucosa]
MLVAVCSLKASPGATTLAVALGARWPGPEVPIVVEADPGGGDLLTRFRLSPEPTLVGLAASTRTRGNVDPDQLVQHAQFLPGGLRVVPGPVGAEQARAALSLLATGPSSPLRRTGDRPDTVVIADCGRVDPASPSLSIIRSADAMLLVVRPREEELARVALKLQAAQQWSPRPCLVLVGGGLSANQVSQELRVPVMAHLPPDVKGAEALCGQGNGRNGPKKSALGRAALKLALSLQARLNATVPQPREPARHLAPVAALQPVVPHRDGASS